MSSRRHVLVSGSFLVILMGVIGLLMTDAHARSGAVVLSTGLQKTIGTAFVSHVASSWDMESDDSFQRFLDTEHPFDPIAYVPVDLAPINSNFTANNAKKFTLRQEA